MGGKTNTYDFRDATPQRVWVAAVQAVGTLGYTVLHSDQASMMLSFNTGRSMSSWGGQDLQMTLARTATGSAMTLGGSLARGGNPFGGGSQIASWGEKSRLIQRFATTVNQILPSVAEPAAPSTAGENSIAQQIEHLASLHQSGAISDAEFAAAKTKLLA